MAIIPKATQMKYFILLASCSFLIGCGKNEEPPPTTALPAKKTTAVAQPAQPAQPAPAPAAVPQMSPQPTAATAPAAATANTSQVGRPANPAAVRTAMADHFGKTGDAPRSWDEMIKSKVIKSVPLDVNGRPLDFQQCQQYLGTHPD